MSGSKALLQHSLTLNSLHSSISQKDCCAIVLSFLHSDHSIPDERFLQHCENGLHEGVSTDYRINKEKEALEIACQNGFFDIVTLIVTRSAHRLSLRVPLYTACEHRHVDIVEFLLERKTIFSVFEKRWALYYACRGGSVEIVSMLVEKGCNQWNWALSGACRNGHLPVVEFLISRGADEWNYGLECAAYGGYMEIVELMVAHGADDWDSGLFPACMRGHTEIIRYMCRKGANRCEHCGDSIEKHVGSDR